MDALKTLKLQPLLTFAEKCYDEGKNFVKNEPHYVDTSEEEVRKQQFLNSEIEL